MVRICLVRVTVRWNREIETLKTGKRDKYKYFELENYIYWIFVLPYLLFKIIYIELKIYCLINKF